MTPHPPAVGTPLAALAVLALVVVAIVGGWRRGPSGRGAPFDQPGRRARPAAVPRSRGVGTRSGYKRGRPATDPAWWPGARWATSKDLAVLEVGHPDAVRGRLVLGSAAGPRRPGRRLLAAEPTQSLAVIGPTQSGKTTALAVPAILGWDGPVVAASVKTDLLRDTVAWRRNQGHVWIFDPTGATGLGSDPWSPLRAARSWTGARRVAADLTAVARGVGTTPDGEFWYATAAKLLAPLFLAAATGGRDMADVIRWVDTQETVEVAELLEAAGAVEALQAARASWLRDDRQRSSVYSTAETVLEPFVDLVAGRPRPGSPGARPTTEIEPEALLDRANTVYLCAPAHDQRRMRGLFVALLQQVVEAAFSRAARRGRPLDPPLLVVLDEAAHIAPLVELDGLAATCAGHGIQLVTVWQDLAQVAARYGPRAATVLNNHRARIFLSGIAEPDTLHQASLLAGDQALTVPSVTRDPGGRRSTTESRLDRRLLPPDGLRQLSPGTGLLVYGSLPPVRLVLRPWWTRPDLAGRGGDPIDR